METQSWVMIVIIAVLGVVAIVLAVSLVNNRQDEDLGDRVESLSSRIDDLESRPGAGQGLSTQEVTDLIQARVSPLEKRVEILASTGIITGENGGGVGLRERICAFVTPRFTQAEWIETDYHRAVELLFNRLPDVQLYFHYGVSEERLHEWILNYCWE